MDSAQLCLCKFKKLVKCTLQIPTNFDELQILANNFDKFFDFIIILSLVFQSFIKLFTWCFFTYTMTVQFLRYTNSFSIEK